jgi:putative selenium metabolism hydrolase
MPDLKNALDAGRLTAFARDLIRTPSLSQEEQAIAALCQAEMEGLGFDQVWTDSLYNVVGVLKGSGQGPTLMFNGHIDHAGVGEMSEPFSAQIREGGPFGHEGPVIYGRGACDMKGAVAAMIHAGGLIKKLGLPLNGDVLVTCVTREEMARGEGVKHLLQAGVTADFAVSGEATGLDVHVGHRGKFEVKVITKGRTSHGGYPQGGINAIFKMNQFMNALLQDYPLPDHGFLGRATVTVLDIIASPGALTPIVPDRCELVIDRRFLPDESQEDLLQGLKALIQKIQAQDQEFQAELESLKWFPAMFTDPQEPIVQAMQKARSQVMGGSGEPGAWYFGTDATFLNQAGIPSVGLGPGNQYLAHTPGDVVPVDQVHRACLIYARLIADLCA